MSDSVTAVAVGGKHRLPTWRVTRRQWVYVALVFIAIALSSASYVAFNTFPPPSRWPAFYAADPASGQFIQPIGGANPYQTFILKSWLDEKIPFVPLLAIPYISFLVLAPVFTPLFTLAVGGFRRFLTVGVALVASQLFLDVAYYLFQTNVLRTAAVPDGFAGFLVSTVQGKDQPFNGYPSGHCTWTTIAIIALWRLRKQTPKTSWIIMPWLCLVYPATVMLQQHYLMDVYAGLFVGFATYWGAMFVVERPRLVPRDEPGVDAAT